MMNVQIKGFFTPKGMKLNWSKPLTVLVNVMYAIESGDSFPNIYPNNSKSFYLNELY